MRPHRQAILTRELVDIDEQIGEGGMGVVFRGLRRDTGETVAVKMLGSRFASQPQFAARFAREIELMSRSELGDCPYLVRYLGHSTDAEAGEYLVFMEYLTGGTLRQRMGGRPLGLEEIGRILPQICTGLSWLHIHGIVHRDIKPENVMFDDRGVAKLTDLGLAKTVFGNRMAATLTRTRSVMGTHYYMSPEQRADSKHVDASADIFSVGVMLYEMLTGTIPGGAAQFVSELCPWTLPARMDQAIARMMASNPRDRYQTAEDVAWVFRKIIGDDFWWTDREVKPWSLRKPVDEPGPEPLPPMEGPPEQPVDLEAEARALALLQEDETPRVAGSAKLAWLMRTVAFAGLIAVGWSAPAASPPAAGRTVSPMLREARLQLAPVERSPEGETGRADSGPAASPSWDSARSRAMAALAEVARAANWYAVLHDGQPGSLDELHPDGEAPRDPWGLPLAISPDRRTVRTSGPDLSAGTDDDLVMELWKPGQIARAQVAWLAGRRPLDADAGWMELAQERNFVQPLSNIVARRRDSGEPTYSLQSTAYSLSAGEARTVRRDPWGRPLRVLGPFVLSTGPDGQFSPDDLIDQRSDEELLVYVRGLESAIWLGDPGGQWELPLTFDASRASLPRWSPDGRQIAYLSQGPQGHDLVTVRPDRTGRLVRWRLSPELEPRELRWLGDGETLLIACVLPKRSRTLALFLLAGGNAEPVEFHPPAGWELRLGPVVPSRGEGFALLLERQDGVASKLELGFFDNSGKPAGSSVPFPARAPVAMWCGGAGGSTLFVVAEGPRGGHALFECESGSRAVTSAAWTTPETLCSVSEGPSGVRVAAAGGPGLKRLLAGAGRTSPGRWLFDDGVERREPDVSLCRRP